MDFFFAETVRGPFDSPTTKLHLGTRQKGMECGVTHCPHWFTLLFWNQQRFWLNLDLTCSALPSVFWHCNGNHSSQLFPLSHGISPFKDAQLPKPAVHLLKMDANASLVRSNATWFGVDSWRALNGHFWQSVEPLTQQERRYCFTCSLGFSMHFGNVSGIEPRQKKSTSTTEGAFLFIQQREGLFRTIRSVVK